MNDIVDAGALVLRAGAPAPAFKYLSVCSRTP